MEQQRSKEERGFSVKWRMTIMVAVSFALHGWLLWAAPAREVQAPSGVVAFKLGQVKLASAALQTESMPPAPVEPPVNPSTQAAPKPVEKKMTESKPVAKKPSPMKSAEQTKPQMVAPAAESASREVSSAPAPSSQQSVSEEPVLVERPAFASPPGAPVYPELARQRRQQGTVVVEVQLDLSGAQQARRLLQSSGVDSLDEAALKAVAGWEFLPYREDGRARLSRVRLPIRFSL